MQHVYANDTYQDPVWVARFTLYKLSASQCMFLLFFCICAACFSISLFVIHGFTVSPNSNKMVAMRKGWQLQLHNFKLSIWTWLKTCKIMQNQRDLVHMSELFAGKECMQPLYILTHWVWIKWHLHAPSWPYEYWQHCVFVVSPAKWNHTNVRKNGILHQRLRKS